jgi:hypothetical protein
MLKMREELREHKESLLSPKELPPSAPSRSLELLDI